MAIALPIYLDHHATTPTDPRVVEAMAPYWTRDFGNPSSAGHAFGWRAEAAVEDARDRLAAAIGAGSGREIVFTSGTTESDNLALKGVARAQRAQRDHIVTAATEHAAVLDACRDLESEGFDVTVLPVDGDGAVDPDAVAAAITPRTALVSIMAANSEVGVIQPLVAVGRVCREREVLFHTDAAQAVGKIPLAVSEIGVDLLSMCAHKLYGPKGIGVLYVRSGRPRIRIAPLVHGGGHERGHRSGTLPVPLIVGFAAAVDLCIADLAGEAARIGALRDRLWKRLEGGIDCVRRNGEAPLRLPGNLNVSFDGVAADALIAAMRDVALSTGSACSSASAEPSHVLRAMGLSDERARGAIRFGIGRGNTDEEIDWVADEMIRCVREQRSARATGRLPRTRRD